MEETYIDLLRSSDPRTATAALLTAIWWGLRTVLFPALVSVLLVRVTITLSHQFDVLARPSDRGSHTIPTPRLGGLGSAAAFYLTMFMFLVWDVHVPLEPWRLTLLVGGAWALIGGALDDFQELPPRWKLLLQLAACGSVVMFGFAPTTLDIPFAGTYELHPVGGTIIAVMITLFWMNIFNFMDGMDGQAATFGTITALGLALYIANNGVQRRFSIEWNGMFAAATAAVAAGTLLGVLLHNHPGRAIHKKTFLGDCGSQFYGFVLAVIALQAGTGAEKTRFPWIASIVLFSPFIYDVVFTLIRRMQRGERLTQAHRTHLYQRLMVAGWSHGKTLLFNILLYVAAVVLAWAYADSAGHGVRQLGILMLTGAILAAYTLAVMQVEKASLASREH